MRLNSQNTLSSPSPQRTDTQLELNAPGPCAFMYRRKRVRNGTTRASPVYSCHERRACSSGRYGQKSGPLLSAVRSAVGPKKPSDCWVARIASIHLPSGGFRGGVAGDRGEVDVAAQPIRHLLPAGALRVDPAAGGEVEEVRRLGVVPAQAVELQAQLPGEPAARGDRAGRELEKRGGLERSRVRRVQPMRPRGRRCGRREGRPRRPAYSRTDRRRRLRRRTACGSATRVSASAVVTTL